MDYEKLIIQKLKALNLRTPLLNEFSKQLIYLTQEEIKILSNSLRDERFSWKLLKSLDVQSVKECVNCFSDVEKSVNFFKWNSGSYMFPDEHIVMKVVTDDDIPNDILAKVLNYDSKITVDLACKASKYNHTNVPNEEVIRLETNANRLRSYFQCRYAGLDNITKEMLDFLCEFHYTDTEYAYVMSMNGVDKQFLLDNTRHSIVFREVVEMSDILDIPMKDCIHRYLKELPTNIELNVSLIAMIDLKHINTYEQFVKKTKLDYLDMHIVHKDFYKSIPNGIKRVDEESIHLGQYEESYIIVTLLEYLPFDVVERLLNCLNNKEIEINILENIYKLAIHDTELLNTYVRLNLGYDGFMKIMDKLDNPTYEKPKEITVIERCNFYSSIKEWQ